MPFLEYPVTRPVVLSRWVTLSFFVAWVAWIIVVTLVSVVAVGYENNTVPSTDFNNTADYRLWYEKIRIPHNLVVPSWSCSYSVIKVNEVVFASPGISIPYTLLGYNDVTNGPLVDGLAYSNNPLVNCEVTFIGLNQFGSEAIQQVAYLSCNTTAGQNVLLSPDPTAGGEDSINFDAYPLSLQTNGKNFNITSLDRYWFWLANNILDFYAAPPGLTSILFPSVVSNNLTALQIEFFGNSPYIPRPNTPAGDYWVLEVRYQTSQSETRIPIAFLPTGEMDMTHTSPENLTTANNLLAPTIQLMREATGDSTFDFWRFINWIYVTYYWGFLADIGLSAPTAYDFTNSTPPAAVPFPSAAVPFPSTNNIFVNETLFQVYFEYYNSTILPILVAQSFGQPPPVLLNDETRFEPIQKTLLRSYICSKRETKGPLSLIISVIAGGYALIVGAYKVVLIITGWWQKRKDDADLKRSTPEPELQELIVSKGS